MPYDFTTWDRHTTEEQTTPIGGNVSGSIPPWLRGSLITNGPGRMKFGDQEYNHLFDGAALLQKIEFTETGPQFSSKFVRSNAYEINLEHNQIIVSEFGTIGKGEPKKGLAKLGQKFSMDNMLTDNVPTSIVCYGSDVYANMESQFLQKIDPKTLDTIGKVDLNKEIGIIVQCPQPIKMKDGKTLAMFISTGATGPRLELYSIPPGADKIFSKNNRIGVIDARWKLNPCFCHSFAATQNYMIIPEQPFTMDIKQLIANAVREKPFIEGLEWMKDKLTKLRVVSRETGKELKVKYKSDPFFYVHTINAYEENDHIVLDICAFSKPDIVYMGIIKKMRAEINSVYKTLDQGKMVRFVLPVNVAKEKSSPEENLVTLNGSKAGAYRQKDGVILLKPEEITDICYENPVINPNLIGQKYNYVYGASSYLEDTNGKIGKVNMNNGEIKLWCRDNLYPCTLSYVPRPGGEAEDDGVVLVFCLHGGDQKSKISLVVLEAATMKELSVIEFETPGQAIRALDGVFVN